MNNVSEKNQENIQNNVQAKISFRKDMKTLKRNLPRIDKSLNGFNNYYKYQDFNDIVEEIENVIEKHNLELDFEQYPISIEGQHGIFDYIRTTFYSTNTDYEFSFDTRIHTDKLQCNNENKSKGVNTLPQQVGSAITYFKRYALVACLRIKSEVDTDAAHINNNYENENLHLIDKLVLIESKNKNKRLITIRKKQ